VKEIVNNHLLGISKYYCLCLFIAVFCAQADVVKPVLVEISVDTQGSYKIEVRASIEAMLTGINSQYTNTKESPNAQAYDDLRVMQAAELEQQFARFHQQFTQQVKLKFDHKLIPLTITAVEIPVPGYTKVPRISLIILEGKIDRKVSSISWYYPGQYADNAVRVRQVDQQQEKWHWSPWQWLRKDQWSQPFSLTEVFHARSIGSVFVDYSRAGFDHILPKGLDHILFILGIFLLSIKLKPLLWQVTMFTIAHSITLSLAMLEIFSLPAHIVEPLIALSIAFIGIENIVSKTMKPSRLFIVFAFGLLHGMGFASMLADFGMPNNAFATALISFNIGVEFGQLTIIALAFLLVGYWFRKKPWYRNIIVIPASLLISITGLYWTYDRIVF
jgi:hydrogenase/urease accessory protein HupE